VSADEAESALPVLLRYWLAERADALARAGTDEAGPDWAALDETRAALAEITPS
jgi:hypothetical protein